MSETAKKDYIRKRRKLSGVFFETALPNEYLMEVGRYTVDLEAEIKNDGFAGFVKVGMTFEVQSESMANRGRLTRGPRS